jgi:DNA-binding PadR family transcriptional regulator
MPDIAGDKLRGHLQDMVLAALERGHAHGLEILRRLEAAGDGSLRLKEGSLYPTLYRLEEDGLLTAQWDEPSPGQRGPRRRIYRLTSKGRSALARSRTQWLEFARVIGGIMKGTAT